MAVSHQQGRHGNKERMIACPLQPSNRARVAIRPTAAGLEGSFRRRQVSPRETISARRLVLHATVRAISMSGFVGLTVRIALPHP
jgi:hypothetical protein